MNIFLSPVDLPLSGWYIALVPPADDNSDECPSDLHSSPLGVRKIKQLRGRASGSGAPTARIVSSEAGRP